MKWFGEVWDGLGRILGSNGILSTDAWVLFNKHGNAFHEQRNLRTKTMSALKNMDENRTTLIPNYANLRHGRAEQLANASRLLGTSWGSLFEMSVEESFAVDSSILVAFDVGKHDDVLRRNFIAPMEQIIRKWASYTKFRPKASTSISFVQSGIKLLFDSFGLTAKVTKTRVRQPDGTRPYRVSNVTISKGEVSALVESSLVKDASGVIFVPFRLHVITDIEHLACLQFNEVTQVGTTYEEIIERTALDTHRDLTERLLRRLEAEAVNDDLYAEAKRFEKIRVEKGRLTNLNNIIQSCVEKEDGRTYLYTTYHRGFGGRGRRYANGASIQRTSRAVRRAIAAANYIDIDGRNAFPTLIANLTEVRDNVENYPSLHQYCTSDKDTREAHLAEVMQTWQCDRSAAKQLFNSLVQTGTIDGWEYNNGLNEMPAFNPRITLISRILFFVICLTWSTEE